MVPASSPGPARTHKPPPGAASKDALYRIAGILDVPVASFFPVPEG